MVAGLGAVDPRKVPLSSCGSSLWPARLTVHVKVGGRWSLPHGLCTWNHRASGVGAWGAGWGPGALEDR